MTTRKLKIIKLFVLSHYSLLYSKWLFVKSERSNEVGVRYSLLYLKGTRFLSSILKLYTLIQVISQKKNPQSEFLWGLEK